MAQIPEVKNTVLFVPRGDTLSDANLSVFNVLNADKSILENPGSLSVAERQAIYRDHRVIVFEGEDPDIGPDFFDRNQHVFTNLDDINTSPLAGKQFADQLRDLKFDIDKTTGEGLKLTFIKYAKAGLRAAAYIAGNLFFELFVPMKRNRVLFASDVRGELGGNFKAVHDALPEGMEARYDFKAGLRISRGIKGQLALVYNLSTCKYILLEDYFWYISYHRVRKGQQICQLWHGAGAFKKFGYSRVNNTENIKIHKGYRKYAKAIVSADPIRKDYAEAFGISLDKVQATGVPRTDIFFDQDYIEKTKADIYETYPILKEKKVILFAPTYRGTRAEDATYDFQMLKPDVLHEALGDDYIFVFKWHPAAYANLKIEDKEAYSQEEYGDFFLDLSQERDINDLLLVTDIMITDYSSVIFDYYLTGKPVVYYVYDLEAYEDGRGLYYDFEDYVYGAVAKTQEELVRAIQAADPCEDKRAAFNERFMAACDGHATKKTVAWLFEEEIEANK